MTVPVIFRDLQKCRLPYRLDYDFVPHIRLKRSGNGWQIIVNTTDLVGVVVPCGETWLVLINDTAAAITRTAVVSPREAAWIIAARLFVNISRTLDDPISAPIPPNSDAFDNLWETLRDELKLKGPAQLPNWQSSPGTEWEHVSRRSGVYHLVKDHHGLMIRRHSDHRVLCKPRVAKISNEKRRRGEPPFVLPYYFDTDYEAMLALKAYEAGWTGVGWA